MSICAVCTERFERGTLVDQTLIRHSNFVSRSLKIKFARTSFNINIDILRRNSEYFARFLDFPGRESEKESLQWTHWPPLLEDCFRLIIEGLYKGGYDPTALSLDKFVADAGVFVIADYLSMHDLKEKAVLYFTERLQAQRHNAPTSWGILTKAES